MSDGAPTEANASTVSGSTAITPGEQHADMDVEEPTEASANIQAAVQSELQLANILSTFIH